MVMTDAAGDAATIHDRMPVILDGNMREEWMTVPADELSQLCRPWQKSLQIDRTDVFWARK
jgi:putative SOS response-associated peptidase YedK